MAKQKVLVLDDDPVRHDAWIRTWINAEYTRANTLAQFSEALWRTRYDTICLDHDLNDHPHLYKSCKDINKFETYQTGMDAAREMKHLPDKLLPKNVLIHSWNRGGASHMAAELLPIATKGVRILIRPFDFDFYCYNAIKMKKDQNYKSIFWNEILPAVEKRSSYDHD